MSRESVYSEMEAMLGLVPDFFKSVPDASLDMEWELFKEVQVKEKALSNKTKELIGLGVAAITHCRYCTFFHTEMAKLFGATDEELQEAVHYAKSSAGWSTYMHGMQVDYDGFKDQVSRACDHIRKSMEQQA